MKRLLKIGDVIRISAKNKEYCLVLYGFRQYFVKRKIDYFVLLLRKYQYFDLQVEIFAKIFYVETMRIVDDIEQQIQKSEFLAILIHAMKSIGESRMTDHHRTAINGLLQKNLTIDPLLT